MTAIQFEGLEIQSGEVERYIRDFIVHVASRERLAIETARAQCSAACSPPWQLSALQSRAN